MINDELPSTQTFSREPENEQVAEAAKRLWLAQYMLDGFAAQWRLMNSARPITRRDLYWLVEMGRLAERLLQSQRLGKVQEEPAGTSSQEHVLLEPLCERWRSRLLHLVESAWLPAKPSGTGRLGGPPRGGRHAKTALRQDYDGVVKQVTDTSVTVEFEVNGDLEVRKFRRDQLNVDFPIGVDDIATVKCTLEFLPPSEYTPSPQEVDELKAAQERHRRIRKKFRRPSADETHEESP